MDSMVVLFYKYPLSENPSFPYDPKQPLGDAYAMQASK